MMKHPFLRIAHIDTEPTWRGGEQQVFSLIKGLARAGHFSLCVVKKKSALAGRLQEINIPVLPISPWGEWDIAEGLKLARILSKNKIQIVHAHSSHAVALAAMVTFFKNIPFVLTRRVDFPLSKNPFSQWKYSRASHIIAISERVREVLIESGIPHQKIQLVPSGVELNRFASVKALTKEKLGVPREAVVIGQVAALAPHKDQSTFLAALERLMRENKNIYGILVGDGPLRKDLERLAQKLGIQDRVLFLGFKNNPLDYLKSFDLFCLSSREEGLGTSILDAMALGVPVVATRAGGIPDVVENGKTGFLVKPRDPEELAQTLARVLSTPKDELEKIVKNSLEKVRQFDIQFTISKTLSVYQKLFAN